MGSQTGIRPKSRRRITPKTQERVHRLAYDFEDLARRARDDGKDSLANSLQAIAGTCGDLARNDEAWQ